MANTKKTLLSESQVRQFMKLAKLEPLSSGFVDGLTEKKKQGYDARLADAEGAKHGKKSQSSEDREHESEAAEEEHGKPKFSGDSEMDKQNESHGRGRGEGAAGYGSTDNNNSRAGARLRELDAPPGEELEFAADDLEGGSPEEDEEASADIEVADDEMGLEDEGEGDAGMVSVDDFLAALGDALQVAVAEVTGEETEVDVVDDEAEEPEMEMGMEMDVEGPEGGEEVVGAEEEMMEGVLAAANIDLVDTSALVEKITKRVAARIVKEALKAKK